MLSRRSFPRPFRGEGLSRDVPSSFIIFSRRVGRVETLAFFGILPFENFEADFRFLHRGRCVA